MARFAIVTDDPGWHGAQLKRALAGRGHVGEFVSLTACRLNLESEHCLPVVVSGFEGRLPDGVFVRGVPGGTLEEVIFYLNVLHGLRELGVKVYNDARAVERTVDKGMTSFLLRRAGVPTPPTWVLRDREHALAVVEKELRAGNQLVTKPLFGSQGEGLQRLESLDDLFNLAASNGVYYLQRFVDCGDEAYHDWRVFVIRGRAVAAMRRYGQTWLNNVAQGGRCEAAALDGRLRDLAEAAVAALDMDYAGVDVIRDANGGFSVIEVNSVPAWKGLQSVCEINVAEALAEDFLVRCDLPVLDEAAS
ncbi:ATP-grasp domain-containing protein [Methylogaea oryzae]|uniref:Lysine biosynthesis protein LysX n=2 Tax=Methylogaea oryzae TaxID=1295382 RepID=A0A8D4VU16_9GAMM|nr:RimK family alpha-L-glutamate ligase [Methylogaea oryzae]BBL72280.1 lysine biosynthesis protein LysX [Methylogaea oryzae]